MSSSKEAGRAMLRHTLATLAYRAGKTLRNAPDGFGSFRAGDGVRTPGEILAHLGDLMDWAVSVVSGKEVWRNSKPQTWASEVERFFAALAAFDLYLASDEPMHATCEGLFQGPIADALTHVGQIGMLRRMAGAPVRGENYFIADIVAGRVGEKQSAAKKEFD